ncbi:MAG: hypothetical protein EKK64_06750 [Neisseriaceae bacterium]|nr:MAG: hypothetical protein EKK64_06750 [Neisseriaceae bacterium]
MMTVIISTPVDIVRIGRSRLTFLRQVYRFFDLICNSKDKIWLKNGLAHRKNDRPAVEHFNGALHWFFNGKRHRDKGPAIILPSTFSPLTSKREEHFFIHGNKYAINKEEEFEEIRLIPDPNFLYEKSILHSIDDMPSIVFKNGTKIWFNEDKFHRENEPAIIYGNGDQEWWRKGKRHRDNGPAVIYGDKQYWFVDGEFQKCIV